MIAAVDAAGLTVRHGHRAVVDGVDLTVGAGDWCTVIGPNGAGKSSLVGAVAGVVPCTGHLRLHGIAVDGLGPRARARSVALVVQHPVIPRGLGVEQYVLLGRTAYAGRLGRPGPADLAAAVEAIDRLGLGPMRSRRLETLSGGERQRAVVARAIAQDAPVLVLDEPTTALDVGFQQDVLDAVDELRRELGLTVLAVMHDLTLAALYADRLVLLDAGHVVATGDPHALLDAELLRASFGARLDVVRHNGRTIVAPIRRRPRSLPPERRPSPPRKNDDRTA